MKAYGGSSAIQLHSFITSALGGGEGKPHAPNVLPRYALSGKQDGPKSRAERFAEEKNSPPPGFRLSFPGC